MKATAVKSILESIVRQDNICQITFSLTTGVKVFAYGYGDGEWAVTTEVDTEGGILYLADETGTSWINTDHIVSISI